MTHRQSWPSAPKGLHPNLLHPGGLDCATTPLQMDIPGIKMASRGIFVVGIFQFCFHWKGRKISHFQSAGDMYTGGISAVIRCPLAQPREGVSSRRKKKKKKRFETFVGLNKYLVKYKQFKVLVCTARFPKVSPSESKLGCCWVRSESRESTSQLPICVWHHKTTTASGPVPHSIPWNGSLRGQKTAEQT